MSYRRTILLLLALAAVAAGPRYIIVIPEALVPTANQLAVRVHTNKYGISGAAGSDTLSGPLTTNALPTNITHRWCNWQFDNDDDWYFLTNRGWTMITNKAVKIFNCSTTDPERVLIDLNMIRVEK